MSMNKFYREARNKAIVSAENFKALALRAKRSGNLSVAIAAARQYRSRLRDVARYEKEISSGR